MRKLLTLLFITILTTGLHAQTTLFSENFESGQTLSSAPTGWSTTGTGAVTTYAQVGTNSVTGGINSSSNMLTFTNSGYNNAIKSTVIDLSSYNPSSGFTYTLSFDAISSGTTNHTGLISVTSGTLSNSQTHPMYYLASSTDTAPSAGGLNLKFDLSSANTWQSFSFDITSGITHYRDSHFGGQNLNDFHLGFQSWAQGSGITSFDNIQLTATAVPEPAAFASIFGIIILAIIIDRRRRA